MPRNNLTNQQFLKDLEKRLPEFTQDELWTLMGIIQPCQGKIMKVIQELNPQVYGWIQEKHSQLEQEKTDKEIDKLKKTLSDQK